MTGAGLTIEPVRLRLRTPLVTARGRYEHRDGFVVALRIGDAIGRGEAMPLDDMGTESLDACQAALELSVALAWRWPLPASVDEVRGHLERFTPAAPAARHALECALLDLAAQSQGLPVARLLSRSSRDSVPVNALLSEVAPRDLAQEGRSARRGGFSVMKVKVGGRPIEEDVARLRALRDAVGPDVRIRIDPNGTWGNAALSNLVALRDLAIELCEQPVGARDTVALGALHGHTPCPIAADESLTSVDAGLELLSGPRPTVDLLALRPMVLGGLLDALGLAQVAFERGVGSFVVSSLDGPLARAAGAHLAASLPSGEWASGLGVGSLFEAEGAIDLLPVAAGAIAIPSCPGWGIGGAG